MSAPLVPPGGLKSVGQYLKVAAEHETRDVVVAYWARFWTVQRALAIDRSSEESKSFIVSLLGWLERRKGELRENEAITNEAVAEAHIENYVIKLFRWADEQDRSGVHNKNVVKAYYTSSLLVDVLENFASGGGGEESGGGLGEEFERMRKYGRWRAAHIHSSLKNGVKPDPPPGANDDDDDQQDEFGGGGAQQQAGDEFGAGGGGGHQQNLFGEFGASSYSDPSSSSGGGASTTSGYSGGTEETVSSNNTPSLGVDVISRAQKYCKWAGSALNFDDVATAIENLEKALSLLKTGVE